MTITVTGTTARMADIARAAAGGPSGALWSLDAEERQLDARLVRLAPGAGADACARAGTDVLLYVVEGTGRLGDGPDAQPLEPGCAVWLPRGESRAVRAGPDGLACLTVRRRRPGPLAPEAGEREGGEPPCLLDRVCPECGRLAPDGTDVGYCGRCGTRLAPE
ncbi:cupin domain-containing protein [Streptomyces sp. SP18CS02]|uniref:cupin domain-containing protein n=1 Tax=Streptomyces sp. SP18CS02 TaxID=3002531 RepID=UPI002E798205|nr:hypothetical protein [Streptomyces sp. SP18CS02]MEE1752612.1 hypothetical protein [Streptomyces sp. SP18CS02]